MNGSYLAPWGATPPAPYCPLASGAFLRAPTERWERGKSRDPPEHCRTQGITGVCR